MSDNDAQVDRHSVDTGRVTEKQRMSPAAAAFAAYRSAEIGTLSQRDLIVKLYQGAERFLTTSANEMDEGHRDTSLEAAQKAKHIFVELLATLDCERGGEVAQRLRALYAFFIGHISQATLNCKPTLLRELLPIVAELRSAWEGIPDELANAGSTEHSQGHTMNYRT